MKDFLKFTLATVTGIILSSIVLFIIGMVTLFGIMAASDTETIVKKNSVMILDLNGTLVERTQEDPLGILSQLFNDDSNTYGLDDILSSIKKMRISKGFICKQIRWGHHTLLYKRFVMRCSTSRKVANLSSLMPTLTLKGFIIFPVQPTRFC